MNTNDQNAPAIFLINYLNNQVTKMGEQKMCNDKAHTNNQNLEFRQLRCVNENKELKMWLNVLCLQSKVKANIFYKILGASKNLIKVTECTCKCDSK